MATAKTVTELQGEPRQIETCEACQSGQHGCQHYFCMCDCRYPLPWRGGANVRHNTIVDANGETIAYDVISATRPSVIRNRILRAVNNHHALVAALGYVAEVIPPDDYRKRDDTDLVQITVTVGWLREAAEVLAAAQE